MILFYCTSSDDGLYLYKISWKYSGRYQSYGAGTIFIVKISMGHNSVPQLKGETNLLTVIGLTTKHYPAALHLYHIQYICNVR